MFQVGGTDYLFGCKVRVVGRPSPTMQNESLASFGGSDVVVRVGVGGSFVDAVDHQLG